jgi:hypothetical protein
MSKAEVLNQLYRENGLDKDDVYQDQRGFAIITRTGIEKIQANLRINVDFEPVHVAHDFVVLKVTANLPNQPVIHTFGEASTRNINNKYIVSMAEKRGLSRAVLKLSGFYKHGVYGEDEFYEEQKVNRERERVIKHIATLDTLVKVADFMESEAYKRYENDDEITELLIKKQNEL